MRLTAKERILLHLLESAQPADAVEVPTVLTQGGVARGTGIELRHLIQFVRPLIRDGLVHERTAHVTGKRQRMKVYGLTMAGRTSATRLRETVRSQVVRIRDGDAVREGSLHEALREVGARTSLLETVRQIERAGILDLETARRPPESGFVEQLGDAPQVGTFVGRQDELAAIINEEKGPRVFVIRGIPGIGKSTLAAKACELLRGRKNLFWHRIRPWESGSMLLANLGRFLETLDRPGLSSVLRRGESRLSVEVLHQDLPDTHAFLILDDAHEASRETLEVIRMLAEIVASTPDVRVVVLTRRALPFYDVRDIAIKRAVREIELDGLKPVEAAVLLAGGRDSAKLVGIGRRLAGHPLLIELVRSRRSDIPAAVRDVHRFVQEAIYGELPEAERRMMKAVSLYQVPVPRATLLSIPGSSYGAVTTLQERSLLRFVGDERYEIHDSIRDFFEAIMSSEERKEFGRLALAQLHDLAQEASLSGDWLASVACISNALRIAEVADERRVLCESLGDMNYWIGDLVGVSAAYREALALTREPEGIARLHRKMAAALLDCGHLAAAQAEIEAGSAALGGVESVECGWLDLERARIEMENYEPEGAAEYAEKAIRTFRRFQERSGEAHALFEAAEAAIWTGDTYAEEPPLAWRYYQEALASARRMEDPVFEAEIRMAMATAMLYESGDYQGGMEHLRAVESSPGAMNDLNLRARFHIRRAWFADRCKRDFATANGDLAEAERIAQRTHNPTVLAAVKWEHGDMAVQLGQYGEAARLMEGVGSDLRRYAIPGYTADAYFCAAVYHLAAGDWEGFQRVSSALHSPEFSRRLEYPFDRPALLPPLEAMLSGDIEGFEASFKRIFRKVNAVPAHSLVRAVILWYDLFYYSVGLRALARDREADSYRRRALELARSRGNWMGVHIVESDFGDRIARTMHCRMKAG